MASYARGDRRHAAIGHPGHQQNRWLVSSEGTVLAVHRSGGLQPFIRKLTDPWGKWFAYVDLFTSHIITEAQHNHAPAISPDGTRVAQVRHTQPYNSSISLYRQPALCEIRVIQYDGTSDRQVLRLPEGWSITKLAWSPDGSEIASISRRRWSSTAGPP